MFGAGPTVLALDVGTSSVRALIFDSEARQVPEALVKVPQRPTAHPGEGATYDPGLLLKRIFGAIDALQARAPGAFARIAAVGVSTFWHSLVGLDEDDRPITPVYLWVDMRSSLDAAALRAELGGEAVRNRTGCPVHAAYLPAKLRWLKRTDPGLFARCARFVSLGELMALQLHGRRAVSQAIASASGLYNLRTQGWDPVVLDACEIAEEALGSVVPHDHVLQGLAPEFRARWPRLHEVPWTPALGDGLTGNLGTAGVGRRRANRIVAMVGTSSAVRAILEGDSAAKPAPSRPVAAGEPPDPLPRGLWAYRFMPGRSLMGGSLGAGGNLVQWIVETFRIGNLQDAEAEIAWKLQGGVNETSGRTESDGIGHLTFLPFLAGERSLGWHDEARAVFDNISFNTQPVDFLRAALESVAFGMADVVEILAPTLPGDYEIVASGNAMVKSAVWIQILADVLGRPILRSPWKEASARGAAMCALVAGGVAKDLADIPALPSEPVEPNAARHARYAEARRRSHELYAKIVG